MTRIIAAHEHDAAEFRRDPADGRPRAMRPDTIATSAPMADSSARCSDASTVDLVLGTEEQQRGEEHQAR